MTPYQHRLMLEDYVVKEKEKEDLKLFEIYLTSLWTSRWIWNKRVPTFKEIMDKLEPKKAMTDEQMLAQVKVLNAMLGGEVKVVGKE